MKSRIFVIQFEHGKPWKRMEKIDPNIKRVTWKKIVEDILAQVELKRGLPYTIKRLYWDPGPAVKDYLFTEKRALFFRPLTFLLLSTTIAAFLFLELNDLDSWYLQELSEEFSKVYSSINKNPEAARSIEDLSLEIRFKIGYVATKYFNLLNILALPIFALSSLLFFPREHLYYTEHLVAVMFMIGAQNLIFAPFAPGVYNSIPISYLFIALSMSYQFYFYLSLFTSYKPFSRVLRGLACLLVCLLSYFLAIIVGAYLIVAFFPVELPTTG